jgi:hypothetical protein
MQPGRALWTKPAPLGRMLESKGENMTRAEIEGRLNELSEQLEDAFDRDDAEAVKRIEREMDALTETRFVRLVTIEEVEP